MQGLFSYLFHRGAIVIPLIFKSGVTASTLETPMYKCTKLLS